MKNSAKKSELETKEAFTSYREAVLTMMEVDATTLHRYCYKVMISLKEKSLTADQYDSLVFDLEGYCKTEGIDF